MTDPLRRLLATVARGPLAGAAAGGVDRLARRRRGVLAILTYHRVDEPAARPDLMPSLISTTPAGLVAQVEMIVRHFDPISLADVLDALDEPERLPRRAVLVTFDDGYRDFATNAWPVLRAASVPATLFVPTAFADEPATPFWWDRLWSAVSSAPAGTSIATSNGPLPVGPGPARATVGAIRDRLKTLDHDDALREVDRMVDELTHGHGPADPDASARPPGPAVLGWDELRTLASEGVTLRPHTRHHPLLDRVPIDRAVEEIASSHADLERRIGSVAAIPRVLAYPSGAHGGSAEEAARRAGMRLAMTTDRGGNDLRRVDPMRLRRINVGGRTGLPLLRAQLAWAATIDARRAPG